MTVLRLFQGTFSDFDQAWFATVGSYFITSWLADSILYTTLKLLKYYVYLSLKLLYYEVCVRIWGFCSLAIRQSELDKIIVGPAFDITSDFAHTLALLFFGMTYAAGVPILMPIMCAMFLAFYSVEKLLLLRYNEKPVASGTQTMRVTSSSLY